LILKSSLKGIRISGSDGDYALVESYSGEEWQDLVEFCISEGLSGIENLTSIPGSVGAAPIQNIGAYGVEIKDLLQSVEAIDLNNGEIKIFSNSDCRFAYRNSIFKQELKGRYFVTRVILRLAKRPAFKIGYGELQQKIADMKEPLSARLVASVINGIRAAKLPDPREIGNCGSFFKNCVVTQDIYETLKAKNPALPGYPEREGWVKIPSAWLIEECGWKGYRSGDAAVYPKHALILVNYGNATGADIYRLSEEIIASVHQRFGLLLEREAQIV
jgi:UDP-N-acetylmuramate dehydrogenase